MVNKMGRGAARGRRGPMVLLSTLLLVLTGESSAQTDEALAPRFTLEPVGRVLYAAGAGVRVHCAARGDPPPVIAWLTAHHDPLPTAPLHWRDLGDGTLELAPARGRREPPPAALRCRAENRHGAVFSRDVRLQPVDERVWRPSLSAPTAARGSVAALSCRFPTPQPATTDLLWFRGGTPLRILPPAPDSRYVVAGDTLLIRDVSDSDAGEYACGASSPVSVRSTPAILRIAERGEETTGPSELAVPNGADFCLPCRIGPSPARYTWLQTRGGRLQSPEADTWVWAGGVALCGRASAALAGAWLCAGHDTRHQVHLRVEGTPMLKLTPSVVVSEIGGSARFQCSVEDRSGFVLGWLHDGVSAGAGGVLEVRGAGRAARGVYQCVARGADGAVLAQATAELRLGDSSPELLYTFIEQALRGGGGVALRCVASGAPSPHVTWLRDGLPLEREHRYEWSAAATPRGDVLATLNVTSARASDGGRYTCRADNRLGRTEHSARLNIYGPPAVRAVPAALVLAGANATVHCPYYGYPISEVTWRRRGGGALVAAGRVAARGAELRLTPARAVDAGLYTCTVAAPPALTATGDVEIQVRNPPKISPFMFSSELSEGSSAQVLCGVSSGDKPMYFSWLKDGAPLPPSLQVEEKSLSEFSLLMFSELSARHSGAYTCRVSNHAAAADFTAELRVRVAPAWTKEPQDTAVLLGTPVLLECAASGYPPPMVTWDRRIGSDEHWERMDSGGELRARGGALEASIASRGQGGGYRCTVDNGVGPALVKHVNLTVHDPAQLIDSSGNVSTVRGGAAALWCSARGDAPLAVRWSRDRSALPGHEYRWSVSEEASDGGLRSTLRVRDAEPRDAAQYHCIAQNHYGTNQIVMFLHVEEPPSAPRGLSLAGLDTRWVRATWLGSLTPDTHYTALLTALHALPGAAPTQRAANLTIETSLNTDETTTLVTKLEGLRPAAAYSLRIIASNRVGSSPRSDPLMFTTLEEAPSAAPLNVRVSPVSSDELHVSWSAPEQESWNGELLGYVARWYELGAGGATAGNEGRQTTRGWSSSELTLSGLRPSTRYVISIRAYNRAGAGPAAPPVSTATLDATAQTPPETVTCEAVSVDSLRVEWSRPSAVSATFPGYGVYYFPLDLASQDNAVALSQTAPAGENALTLRGLQPATNYSVWVRAQTSAGTPSVPSAPAYCITTADSPGTVSSLRALPSGADSLLVTWLTPHRAAGLTHYTLHVRELGKSGGERSHRVEPIEGEEQTREVRELRPVLHAVWVVAHAGVGAAPPSRRVSATPAEPGSVRISSFGREISVPRGARVVFPCVAVGSSPVRRRWTPVPAPPAAHSVSDAGDLVLHEVTESLTGNYTCRARNVGGDDSVTHRLVVVAAPDAPAARLLRAEMHALHVAWDTPRDNGAPVLGYWVSWSTADGRAAGRRGIPRGESTLALRGLPCGAEYRVLVQAYNAVGPSPLSAPVHARTKGDKAVAPLGIESVWANSSALRVNLLSWRAWCPQPAYSVALRRPPAPFAPLPSDAEAALASGLQPAAWYEIRVRAHTPLGDTEALYRAATLAPSGVPLGAPALLTPAPPLGPAPPAPPPRAAWRRAAAPALFAGSLAALLAALAGAVAVRRRSRRESGAPPQYPDQTTKQPGKTLTPPPDELEEISPYATFSMAAGCALQMRSFGRAEPPGLTDTPRSVLHSHSEYAEHMPHDSDSESSGSGACPACALAAPPVPDYDSRARPRRRRDVPHARRAPPTVSSINWRLKMSTVMKMISFVYETSCYLFAVLRLEHGRTDLAGFGFEIFIEGQRWFKRWSPPNHGQSR